MAEHPGPFVRDPRAAFVAYPERCDLIFRKPDRAPTLEERLINLLTGSRNLYSVNADCGWQIAGHTYLAASRRAVAGTCRVDGPHFCLKTSPLLFARVAMNDVLDAGRFRASLERSIADPNCRHKGKRDILSYLRGTTPANRVTCSGFIGRAILEQPDSVFALALRRVLRHRITYGEITPANLLRAAILLNLSIEGCTTSLIRPPGARVSINLAPWRR